MKTDAKTGSQLFQYDPALLFPALFLVGIGIVMVYSASSALALKRFGADYFYLKRQAIFALLGIMALVGCRRIPYRLYRTLTYPLLLVTIVCLVAVLMSSLGHTAGGATRWLRLGSFTFQPSEFARFSLVVYLAYSMSRKQDRIQDFQVGFLPHLIVLGVLVLLILKQPDFGSVIILGALTWAMLFVGGVRIRHLLLTLGLFLPAAGFLLVQEEYRWRRLVSFMDPWQYPADAGYQIVHSLMAFGTGGFWGTGIGQGYQKLFYLPEPHTDFILSVIGEELGLLGILLIIGLYFLILWRGIVIARNTEDLFGSFMAFGLTIAMMFQVCVNMGVALGLLPTKGLTLPFLSYGGTSLLLNMACIGILMNISASRQARPEEKTVKRTAPKRSRK